MAVTTTNTNKPLIPRGVDDRPVDKYNRAELYSGKALDFDGVNDEVNCGDIDIAFNEISFAFHFNADSFSNNCIFQKESVFRFIGVNTNQIDIVLATTGNSWYSKKMTLTNLESKDYFLVSTYDGSELKTYLNGVLVDTLGGYSGSVANFSQNVYVGRTDGGLYYNGKVSGTKIFNTALTAAQVADLYNNPEKVVPTGVANTALKLWLPMQEGAGTTAYDGSGNGNHGTISGATYVHGIGAPVAQTAVIDWNKGVNLVEHSEEVDDAYFNKSGVSSIAANNIVAPDGRTTADKVNINSDSESGVRVFKQFDATQYTMSFYAKAGTQTDIKFYVIQQGVGIWRMDIDLINGVLSNVGAGISNSSITDVGDGWWRITATRTFTAAASNHGYGAVVSSGNGTNFYLWGFQHKQAATAGPYIPTFGSAQTSDVLLPQGLTTGRDITGVNLFENVRKQGALNLDGNSWAEVHDNGSLDFGTGSFTLEAWAKAKYVNQGSSYNVILNLGGNLGDTNTACLASDINSNLVLFYGANGTATGVLTSGDWAHIVGVYDGANAIVYANGVKITETARTPLSVTNALSKRIGRDTTSTRYYNDQLAQPRIYNRGLTASEVLQNYNATKDLYI